MFFPRVHWPSAVTLFMAIVAPGTACATDPSHPRPLFSIRYDGLQPRFEIALIIPGLHQSDSDPGYDSIGACYKSIGVTPVYVNIDWKAVGIGKLSACALQIRDMLADSFPESHRYLFGFSFGAVISLKLSQLIQAQQIILCSMSPLFAEDRAHQIFPFRQILGMVADYSTNGLSYSRSRGTCVYFLYGDHDSFMINKAIIQNRKASFTCNETTIVPQARHAVSGGSYLKAIKRIIGKINK